MILNPNGEMVVPSFREILSEDFSSISHNCAFFKTWSTEAYFEENSRVFMCSFPGQDNKALGFISLIPYELENNGGYVEIYMLESSYPYVGTHLVAWACKMGLNWFQSKDVYFYVKAIPKNEGAVDFFEKIGAEINNIEEMIIYSDVAEELIKKCGI